jgi:hypothetical protein
MSRQSALHTSNFVANGITQQNSARQHNRLTKGQPVQGKQRHWWSRREKKQSPGALYHQGENGSAGTPRNSLSSTNSNEYIYLPSVSQWKRIRRRRVRDARDERRPKSFRGVGRGSPTKSTSSCEEQ